MTLTFDPDNTKRCVEFNIKQDGLTEGMEDFTTSLESSDMVNLVPDRATIGVRDSDSKYDTVCMIL